MVSTIALRLLQAYANLLICSGSASAVPVHEPSYPPELSSFRDSRWLMSFGPRNSYCRGLIARECYSSCLFARLPGFRLATLGVRMVLRRRKTGSRSPTLSDRV